MKPEKIILTINGKELDRTHGLDWYDYGTRQHDPFVPGFTSLDPLCEKYYQYGDYTNEEFFSSGGNSYSNEVSQEVQDNDVTYGPVNIPEFIVYPQNKN